MKIAWRKSRPKTVSFWYELEDAAKKAIKNPGKEYGIKNKYISISYKVEGSFLFCRLPNGRQMFYPYPKLAPVKKPWGDVSDSITYKTYDSQIRKFVRVSTYGGKLCENAIQATARELLATSLFEYEKRKKNIVLHVHDEVLGEIPMEEEIFEMEEIMAAQQPWTKGLPLGASGWTGMRYKKD